MAEASPAAAAAEVDSSSTATPPTESASAKSSKDPVAAALASGEWREKFDKHSQRKYYVNKATGKATWNLAKELAKHAKASAPSAAAKPAAESKQSQVLSRADRHERTQKRQAAELELKTQISQLESTKVELETDIARLQAPVEAESKRLADLRRQLADKKFGIEAVQLEAQKRRQVRDAELRAVMTKIASLQSSAENEQQFRDGIEQRHKQLLIESMELTNDLQKERAAADALRLSVSEAERKIEAAKVELDNLQSETRRREELVEAATVELREAAQRKARVKKSIEDAKAEKARLLERHKKSQRIAKAASDLGEDSNAVVAALTEQYHSKVKSLEALSKMEQLDDDAMVLEHSNQKLRALVATADRDSAQLTKLARQLEGETRRVADVVTNFRSELKEAMRSLAEMEKRAVKTPSTAPAVHANK